jgi:hypothetical protein
MPHPELPKSPEQPWLPRETRNPNLKDRSPKAAKPGGVERSREQSYQGTYPGKLGRFESVEKQASFATALEHYSSHVRGHTAYIRSAGTELQFSALIADIGVITIFFFFTHKLFGLAPYPQFMWIAVFGLEFLIFWMLQRFFLQTTIGERIWHLATAPRALGEPRWKVLRQLCQPERLDAKETWTCAAVTAAIWIAALGSSYYFCFGTPFWIRAEARSLNPFHPQKEASASGEPDWTIEPFYFVLGAWPKTYEGHPVFYSVPYLKGPPTLFLGEVVARWEMPDTRVTIRGPKTPPRDYTREEVSRCLFANWVPQCIAIREFALLPHLKEMEKTLGFTDRSGWRVAWFKVENPAIPEKDQAQGIFIHAQNSFRVEERYVVMTAKGAQQTYDLQVPRGERELRASQTLEQAIRSSRFSDDLNPGRLWVDSQIEAITPESLAKAFNTSNPSFPISELESLLIAKLTVDPKTFDTYYLLGKLGSQLTRYATQTQQSDLGAVAKPLLQNMQRYGLDVSPKDPRNLQLQDLWLDAQKH